VKTASLGYPRIGERRELKKATESYWKKEISKEELERQAGEIRRRTWKTQKEAGIDISSHFSKTVDELPNNIFDFVITVCDSAKENCPYFPGGKVIHVGFQDPPALTREMINEEEILAVYRKVRDEIHEFMKNLKNYL
jgi:arsenate reductase